MHFTPNLQRHLDCPSVQAPGATVGQVLNAVFAERPVLRGYILDDQARVRRHIAVFVDGRLCTREQALDQGVGNDSEVFIMQALSGG